MRFFYRLKWDDFSRYVVNFPFFTKRILINMCKMDQWGCLKLTGYLVRDQSSLKSRIFIVILDNVLKELGFWNSCESFPWLLPGIWAYRTGTKRPVLNDKSPWKDWKNKLNLWVDSIKVVLFRTCQTVPCFGLSCCVLWFGVEGLVRVGKPECRAFAWEWFNTYFTL